MTTAAKYADLRGQLVFLKEYTAVGSEKQPAEAKSCCCTLIKVCMRPLDYVKNFIDLHALLNDRLTRISDLFGQGLARIKSSRWCDILQ